jgi:hypothetical protein
MYHSEWLVVSLSVSIFPDVWVFYDKVAAVISLMADLSDPLVFQHLGDGSADRVLGDAEFMCQVDLLEIDPPPPVCLSVQEYMKGVVIYCVSGRHPTTFCLSFRDKILPEIKLVVFRVQPIP